MRAVRGGRGGAGKGLSITVVEEVEPVPEPTTDYEVTLLVFVQSVERGPFVVTDLLQTP
jgi:hypothetical protein